MLSIHNFNDTQTIASSISSNSFDNNSSLTNLSSLDKNDTFNYSNVPELKDVYFRPKEILYFKSIDSYYKNLSLKYVQQMIDIIEGNSILSLRLLDWFVTKYSKKYNIKYNIDSNNFDFDNKFVVHISYKAQLRAYKKEHFDPFRRRKKFFYTFKQNNVKIPTTIGQLHFFKWAFDNNIIDYVISNHEKIKLNNIINYHYPRVFIV